MSEGNSKSDVLLQLSNLSKKQDHLVKLSIKIFTATVCIVYNSTKIIIVHYNRKMLHGSVEVSWQIDMIMIITQTFPVRFLHTVTYLGLHDAELACLQA